jgi:hypothetical protein
MPAPKIQDETEVKRWFEEGRTYAWMQAEYRRKYNIDTTLSMWGNFRRKHGLARRIQRDDELIPWAVQREHRWRYPVMMLRQEARRRAGFELTPEQIAKLDAWKRGLADQGAVVHYEPDTEDGWFYVPARPGIDTDLIRVPSKATTARRNADR